MKDYSDLAVAAESLSDPATSASDLALIAEYQPSLHSGVAMHPAAYGDLLDWLDEQGNPQLSRIVIQRRSTAKDLASSATAFSQVADDSTSVQFFVGPDDAPERYALTERKSRGGEAVPIPVSLLNPAPKQKRSRGAVITAVAGCALAMAGSAFIGPRIAGAISTDPKKDPKETYAEVIATDAIPKPTDENLAQTGEYVESEQVSEIVPEPEVVTVTVKPQVTVTSAPPNVTVIPTTSTVTVAPPTATVTIAPPTQTVTLTPPTVTESLAFIGESEAVVTRDADAVSLQQVPDCDARVLDNVPPDSVVTVTGPSQGGWYPVIYDGTPGWMSGFYLRGPGVAPLDHKLCS